MASKRNIGEAAIDLARASEERLRLIARRDPDMIRDVARSVALIAGPDWGDHAANCSLQDNERGPCTCGAEDRFRASLYPDEPPKIVPFARNPSDEGRND